MIDGGGSVVPREQRGSLEKELNYYRRMCSDLGRELQKTQDDRDRLLKEVRRYHVRDMLDRALSSIAAQASDLRTLATRVLEAVVELTLWSRAIVLSADQANPRLLNLVSAVGLDQSRFPKRIELDAVPLSGYTTDDRFHPADAGKALRAFVDLLGLRSVMWTFDPETGIGLLLATATGPAIAAFRPHDEDLAQTALNGIVDGVWRLRSQQHAGRDSSSEVSGSWGDDGKPLIDPTTAGIQEGQITEALDTGQRIMEVLVIAQEDNSFLLFVSPSWGQGFRIVRKFRDAGNRIFKNFDRLLSFVRGPLRYRGRVIIYSTEAADVASMAGGDIDKSRSAKSSRSHLSVVGG